MLIVTIYTVPIGSRCRIVVVTITATEDTTYPALLILRIGGSGELIRVLVFVGISVNLRNGSLVESVGIVLGSENQSAQVVTTIGIVAHPRETGNGGRIGTSTLGPLTDISLSIA